MTTPIVYRWDDGNAPVISGTRGSFINALRKCLVDGYGEKPAAGWTLEFIDANLTKAAFRNSPITGTGFFLQVDEATPTLGYAVNLQAFELMTSESAGTNPFNIAANGFQFNFYSASAVGTTSRPWVIIADDRAFYFFIWYSITGIPTNNDVTVMNGFFGDFISRHASDAFACALNTGWAGAIYSGLMQMRATAGASTSDYTKICLARRNSATPGGVLAWPVYGGGPVHDSLPGFLGHSYTAGDQIIISRPYLNDGAAYTFRGWLPGLYHPCHTLAFDQLATVAADGKSMLSIRNCVQATSYKQNLFISLDDWRA